MTHCDDTEAPDAALLAAFRKTGSHAAFEALMLRHGDSMRRFLAAGMGWRGDMDEAEQEVLIRLFGSLRSFDGRSSLATFIYRICRRVAADAIRRCQRDRKKLRRFMLLRADESERSRDTAHKELADEETRAEILAALNTLAEPDRSILFLRDAENVPVAELARSFGIPEGTVKSRLSRSREKLRAVLGAPVHGGGSNHG